VEIRFLNYTVVVDYCCHHSRPVVVVVMVVESLVAETMVGDRKSPVFV
jgi:hypothetical protein